MVMMIISTTVRIHGARIAKTKFFFIPEPPFRLFVAFYRK